MPVSIETVRSVQFGREFDWELKFDKSIGLTKPFDSWFPAVEVDYGLADLQLQSLELPTGVIFFPLKSSETDIQITFLDDYKGTLEKWLESWMKKISSFNKGVLPLDLCYKIIFINRLSPVAGSNGLKSVLDSKKLAIIPNGTFQDRKTQNSNAKTFSMNFKIVGN